MVELWSIAINSKIVEVPSEFCCDLLPDFPQFNFVSMDSLSDVFTKMKSSSSELDVTEIEDQHVEPNLKEIIEKELNNL